MAKAKYRIKTITIEGFRGFTTPQTIEIASRNAFIFGVNGQGKSSIVEAIRWALFGSTGAQEIEVSNTFYPKAECIVCLDLVSAETSLQIKRELRPGTTRSQKTIRDAAGNTVSERDVLPQLARIGHHEGTQVIFAAQHTTGRQAQVDITDFTRVLCFYMSLEKVPELVEQLGRLIAERQEEFRMLAQQIEQAESGIKSELQQAQSLADLILRNPPWGEGSAPTGSQTEERIIALVGDAARTRGISVSENVPPQQALTRLRHDLDRVGGEKMEAINTKMESVSQRQRTAAAAIQAFREATQKRVTFAAEIQKLNERLSDLLNGETFDALHSRLADIERSLSEKAASSDLASRAKELCVEYRWSRCPVCGSDHSNQNTDGEASLEHRIEESIQNASEAPADPAVLLSLRTRIKQIPALNESVALQTKELRVTELMATMSQAQITATFPEMPTPFDISHAEIKLAELVRDIEELKGQAADSEGHRQHWAKRVKDLEQELAYHSYRDTIQGLQIKLTEGLDAARAALAQYHDLLNTASQIQEELEIGLRKAMDRAVPPLEQMMTSVYQRLTQQPSYDQVKIICPPESSLRRELRVSASRLPGQDFLPNVLNGQAAKALQLVPYFVFSQFQSEILELDLLLIDDPSESFDTSHVAELIAELGRAAGHAQLFVATHEREKFEAQLSSQFPSDSRTNISVEGFTTMEGPKLAYR